VAAMNAPSGPQLTIAAAVCIAITVPSWVLWPARYSIPVQPEIGMTKLRVSRAAELDAALRMPLFTIDRTPAPDVELAEDASDPAAVSAPPILVGTIANGRAQGIVLAKTLTGETVTLTVGSEVDGWRLVRIGNGSAQFEQGGRRETVTLDFRNRMQNDADVSLGQNTAGSPRPDTKLPNEGSPQ
jgi:hypothetical protein